MSPDKPRSSLPLAAFVLCALATGAALAQPADTDSSLGRRLVRKYCSNCHDVVPHPTGQRRGADGAPGFAALAADPVKGSPAHIKSVLGGPHSAMPPHKFSDAEVDGVIGYFHNLKPKAK